MTNEQIKTTKMIWDSAWPYLVTHPIAGLITLKTAENFDEAWKELKQMDSKGFIVGEGHDSAVMRAYRKSSLRVDANPLNLMGGALEGYLAQLITTPLVTYSLTENPYAAAASLVAQIGATAATGYLAYRKAERMEDYAEL